MQFRIGKKIEMGEEIMNLDNIKKEFKEAIIHDNHYENVDNAKKRAVKQGMDYDNFRQMVLGADIKPIKTREILDLTAKSRNYEYQENPEKFNDLFFEIPKGKQIDFKNENLKEEIEEKFDIINYKELTKSLIYLENNFKLKNLKAIEFLNNILDSVLKNDLNKIITIDFEIKYFILIIDYYLNCKENIKNYDILINFLREITKTKKFKIFKLMFKTNDKYIIKLLSKKIDLKEISEIYLNK